MDKYDILLTLNYFIVHKEDYDLDELKRKLGLSNKQLIVLINEMFDNHLLEYKGNLITLTLKGRMTLINTPMDDYCEMDDIEGCLFNDKWPVDKPFYVHGFSKKKWRGSR